jgi:hypothetical protein
MAAPTFKAKGTIGETTGSSVSFTYPTVAANDLLFLVVLESELKAITVNSSWTQRGKQFIPAGSPNYVAYLYSKLATGSESGTEAVTRVSSTGDNTFAAQVYSYDGDNYITIESNSKNADTTDTVTFSAVTVGGTERTLSAIVVNVFGAGVTTPSGYTESATDTLSDDTVFECNTKSNVSSDGAVTGTGGSGFGWAAFHVAMYNNTPTPGSGTRTFIVN